MAPDDFPAGGYVTDWLAFCAAWIVVVAGTVVFFRRTRGRAGRLRLVAGNLLVLLCLLATLALGAETYLRWVYDASDQWGVTLTNVSWAKRHFHPNSKLFRDREFTGKPRPGVTRIACVGDSFTMAWGVPDAADAWPQRLGALLEAKEPGRFETLNLGRAGASTGDEAALLEQMAGRGVFERVVLGYCLNDIDDLQAKDRQFDAKTLPRPGWIAPTRSFLVDFLWFRLRLRDDPRVAEADARQIGAYEDPAVWAAQKERMRHAADACRAAGLPLDVIVFPFFSEWGEGYRYDGCHERVAAAWKELGVNVIDLREAYRGLSASELRVNRFDGHPNARAQDVAARVVAERVFGVR